jgi:HSP20 family protein
MEAAMQHRDMWDDIARQLSDAAEGLDRAVRRFPPFSALGRDYPPVNVYETDTEVLVRAAVPGIPRGSLELVMQMGRLTIAGKEDRSAYEGYKAVTVERGPAEFSREIVLPDSVDPEAEPAAVLQDGVLTVRVPKLAPKQARSIDINVT